MMAPPTPCIARDTCSISVPVANPHSSEAPVNTASPIRNNRRRPYMSDWLPAVSRNAASVSAYASTIHCRPEKPEPSPRWMSGSATVTIVISSNNVKMPGHTATSVHHLLPRRAGAPARCSTAARDTPDSAVLRSVISPLRAEASGVRQPNPDPGADP